MNGLYDEIRIALHSVWNRRWLAMVVAWAFCVIGWTVVVLIPNSYESKARVSVQMQSILAGKIGVSPRERKRNIDRVQQTLKSTINLEKVVRGTDLNLSVASDRELAAKVEMLNKNITIESDRDNIFSISAVSSSSNMSDAENAKLAPIIVQKLIDIFVEENLAGDRDETTESVRFYDGELAGLEKQLQEAEQKRVEFETKYLGLLPGAGSISQRMSAARAELGRLESQLISARSSLAALNGQLAGTPATLNTPRFGGTGGGVHGRLAAARSKLSAAKARGWTDNHPDMASMKAEIAALSRQAASTPKGSGTFKTPNPAYSSLIRIRGERSASLAALQARKNALERDLASLAAKQTQEPGVAAELAQINRDYKVLKAQYDKILADREDVKLRGKMESETNAIKFKTEDRPTIPRTPIAPNRPLLLALILFAGIGAGIGAAFAMGHLRTSFPTAAKLEKASGLPVIGAVSQMLTNKQRGERKKKMRLFYGGSGALVALFVMLMAVEFIQRGLVA